MSSEAETMPQRCPVYPRYANFGESECKAATARSSVNPLCHGYRCTSAFKACLVCVAEVQKGHKVEAVAEEFRAKGLCRLHAFEGRQVVMPSPLRQPTVVQDTPWEKGPERTCEVRVDTYQPQLEAETWRKKHRRQLGVAVAPKRSSQGQIAELTQSDREHVKSMFVAGRAIVDITPDFVARMKNLPTKAVRDYWVELQAEASTMK